VIHRHRLCEVLLLVLLYTSTAQAEENMNLEESVCGLREPFLFWLWSRVAGRPDAGRVQGLENAEDISLGTHDGRILRGYKLKAQQPVGYLLVFQGNAMLADQILAEFSRYADAGYDVYIFDYRGYGRSDGKRRLQAIVSDIREIVQAANNSQAYKQRLVYAMSLGGVMFMDALQADFSLNRVVIDSSPSRLSDYDCPMEFDPISHLPEDCEKFMFIAGLRDHIVTPAMSRDLLDEAEQCGATVVRDAGFAHPFMDNWNAHQRRKNVISEFLLGPTQK
jgi:pimeloyl-ACP methyl ester carboxylesterase